MDKRSAMEMVNEHWGSRLLDRGNTSFANINTSKPVWWINIHPSKFKSDLHLLLAKEGDGGLIWFANRRRHLSRREKGVQGAAG